MTTAADRLHLLYDVNRRLATFTELDELLRYATRRTREVLGAEGCAILLLDANRREFYFPIASQAEARKGVEARLAEIRFPADRGIAGWVLSQDQAALVNDVANDARFYSGVDQQTSMTTRALLCAPLRSRGGSLGVIEVVNPAAGAFANDDLEFLEALAGDIVVAHEKAQLYEQLHHEVIGLRQYCRFLGWGLAAVGVLLSVGATIGHLAVSLPLGELFMRPGMLTGMTAVALGALLIAVGQGWLVGRRAPSQR
ncbi:MAG TPA: GAF domain-containing protein [Candidatus Kryptonia bacterium]|nr:GAF domain-containing protein [Candidatus Kryptonia bacterium]